MGAVFFCWWKEGASACSDRRSSLCSEIRGRGGPKIDLRTAASLSIKTQKGEELWRGRLLGCGCVALGGSGSSSSDEEESDASDSISLASLINLFQDSEKSTQRFKDLPHPICI